MDIFRSKICLIHGVLQKEDGGHDAAKANIAEGEYTVPVPGPSISLGWTCSYQGRRIALVGSQAFCYFELFSQIDRMHYFVCNTYHPQMRTIGRSQDMSFQTTLYAFGNDNKHIRKIATPSVF
jgi:hypothetical protein